MNNQHKLNKDLERLEPIKTSCIYCRTKEVSNIDQCYYLPLYKTKSNIHLIVYQSIKYDMIKVGVPRCSSCHSIHQYSYFISWILSLIVTVSLGYYIYLVAGFNVLFYLVFGATSIMILGPVILTSILVSIKGRPEEKEGAKRDPLIREMLNNGWSTTIDK